MGLLDKIMFWKKEEEPFPRQDFGSKDFGFPDESHDLGLPKPGGPGLPGEEQKPGNFGGVPEYPSPSFGAPRLEETAPPQTRALPQGAVQMEQTPSMSNKDLEIISLKLDSMKATLEAINERIARLEKIAEGERESPRF
ncbi:hypothetical protein JW707_02560 [Candidatus Woesearchaeota archaeon]|nr:hypothetical protein [Candidatus Woesearchaeota archaeon]